MFGRKKQQRGGGQPKNERVATTAQASVTQHAKATVYKAKDGYRWRLTASNGRILADSGEAYVRRYECKLALQRLVPAVMDMKIEYADEF